VLVLCLLPPFTLDPPSPSLSHSSSFLLSHIQAALGDNPQLLNLLIQQLYGATPAAAAAAAGATAATAAGGPGAAAAAAARGGPASEGAAVPRRQGLATGLGQGLDIVGINPEDFEEEEEDDEEEEEDDDEGFGGEGEEGGEGLGGEGVEGLGPRGRRRPRRQVQEVTCRVS